MSFKAGDHVHVANLGKGIVREVRNSGRYLVELKGRSILLAEGQLRALEETRRRSKTGQWPEQPDRPEGLDYGGLTRAHAPAEIDLHGMTAAEAVSALDAFLNDAILASRAEARVIHGRSGGRLKAAVHQRLRELPSIRSFRVDPANPGITIIAL